MTTSDQFPDRTRETDEFAWLEDIYGEEQLAWVREQNERTAAAMDQDAIAATQSLLRKVYDSADRIAYPTKHGDHYYNFWQDADHPRGIWRRTTPESYRADDPEWDVLLDIDALGKKEDKEFVFQGASLLHSTFDRALVRLSPDGGDAVEIREFDLGAREFVADGFNMPWAKSRATWIDRDTIGVATDFGPGTMTTSSYARQARRWKRGTPLAEAELIYEVPVDHMAVGISHDHTEGYERTIIWHAIDFFHARHGIVTADGVKKIDVPDHVELETHREWLLIRPREAWTVEGQEFPAGSLLAARLDAWLAGGREVTVLFTPDDRTALVGWSWTKSRLLLNAIEDVASRIEILTPGEGDWAREDLPGLGPLQTANALAVDVDDNNQYWLMSTSFLQPETLSIGDAVSGGTTVLKSGPSFFDESAFTVEQHFVASDDGTRIPYFQIAPNDSELDGNNPTLLTGYGGFEVPLRPGYDGGRGRTWLERGGTLIVANIRGGGEYGPNWHTTALKQHRHRAYEDFAAIALDLVDRGVTRPERLGISGGSNGGLLVGNMLTHYPDRFGAVVCLVPLLDMQRYIHLSAGASWIAEYGDPDKPEEWAFIQTFSPYHNLREGVDYPPVLFYTATSDDRVGPVQARKMAARMQDRGIPNVWFYENMEGGHAGSADSRQRAQMQAMSAEFLWHHLTD